jgi:hypothetical protein
MSKYAFISKRDFSLNIIFSLIGGGFALIHGMLDSNFLALIDMDLKDLWPSVILLGFCCFTVILTQVANNTAVFFIIAPIAARVVSSILHFAI